MKQTEKKQLCDNKIDDFENACEMEPGNLSSEVIADIEEISTRLFTAQWSLAIIILKCRIVR